MLLVLGSARTCNSKSVPPELKLALSCAQRPREHHVGSNRYGCSQKFCRHMIRQKSRGARTERGNRARPCVLPFASTSPDSVGVYPRPSESRPRPRPARPALELCAPAGAGQAGTPSRGLGVWRRQDTQHDGHGQHGSLGTGACSMPTIRCVQPLPGKMPGSIVRPVIM